MSDIDLYLMRCDEHDIIKTIKAIRNANEYLEEPLDLRAAKTLVDTCRELGCPVVIGELREDISYFSLVSELTKAAEGHAVFAIDPTDSAIAEALVFNPADAEEEDEVEWIELEVAAKAAILLVTADGNIARAVVTAQLLARTTDSEVYYRVSEFLEETFATLTED